MHSLLRKVWRNAVVSYDGMAITLGNRYAGAVVRIVEVGELIHAYLGDELHPRARPRPREALPEARQAKEKEA